MTARVRILVMSAAASFASSCGQKVEYPQPPEAKSAHHFRGWFNEEPGQPPPRGPNILHEVDPNDPSKITKIWFERGYQLRKSDDTVMETKNIRIDEYVCVILNETSAGPPLQDAHPYVTDEDGNIADYPELRSSGGSDSIPATFRIMIYRVLYVKSGDRKRPLHADLWVFGRDEGDGIDQIRQKSIHRGMPTPSTLGPPPNHTPVEELDSEDKALEPLP